MTAARAARLSARDLVGKAGWNGIAQFLPLYLRFVKHELVLFAIVVAFFGLVISRLVHVETLLALLTAGFVTENVSRHEDGEAIRHAMERSAAPVFVVFFALIEALGSVRAMVFTYINPAVAAVLGVAVLGERFTAGMGIGFVLILLGSALAVRPPRPPDRRDRRRLGVALRPRPADSCAGARAGSA